MKVGDLEVVQVLDGEWITPAAPGIPQMSPEELAQHVDYLPADGTMKAALGAFLVRTGSQVVLIDAGLGPRVDACGSGLCGHARHGSGAAASASSAPSQFEAFFREKGVSPAQISWYGEMLARQRLEHGWLEGNLARLGVRPDEITDVVLSHLHPDHTGWVARDGVPFFPRARLWAHRADVDLFLGADSPDETAFKILLGVNSTKERMAPVLAQIRTWERDCTIAPGIDLRWLPGHTPGSSIAIISSRGERAMVLGDVIHCPLELVDDEFAIMADIDPAMAKQAKALVRREIEGAAIHVSSSHFPGLRFGRLMPGAGRRYWQWAP